MYLRRDRYLQSAQLALQPKGADILERFVARRSRLQDRIRQRLGIDPKKPIPWSTELNTPEMREFHQLCDSVDGVTDLPLDREPCGRVTITRFMLTVVFQHLPTVTRTEQLSEAHLAYAVYVGQIETIAKARGLPHGLMTQDEEALLPKETDEAFAALLDKMDELGLGFKP